MSEYAESMDHKEFTPYNSSPHHSLLLIKSEWQGDSDVGDIVMFVT